MPADGSDQVALQTRGEESSFVASDGCEGAVSGQQQHARPSLVYGSREKRRAGNGVVPCENRALLARSLKCVVIWPELIVNTGFRYFEICPIAHRNEFHVVVRVHVEIQLQKIVNASTCVVNRTRVIGT